MQQLRGARASRVLRTAGTGAAEYQRKSSTADVCAVFRSAGVRVASFVCRVIRRSEGTRTSIVSWRSWGEPARIRVDAIQSRFMSTTVQPCCLASPNASSSTPIASVRKPIHVRVGVMYQQRKRTQHRRLSLQQSPDRRRSCRRRRAGDGQCGAGSHRFGFLVVEPVTPELGQDRRHHETRSAVCPRCR